MPGRFFVLEGIDGCGKTTQAQLLEETLLRRGHHVLLLREPGGTDIGERIRGVLLDSRHAEMAPWTELFLFMASRAQLLHEKIRPALAAGGIVILDRYYYSTAAYQGAAGGIGIETVLNLAEDVARFDKPDLVFVLDIDPDEARRRLKPDPDRMENKGTEYQRRVREGFARIAKQDPRVRVLDGSKPPQEVQRRVLEEVQSVL